MRSDHDHLGDAVHGAYRPFSLRESQRNEHREQLAATGQRRGADRLRSHVAELGAVAALVVIALTGFLVWNSLEPGSNDNDSASTDVKCFSDLPNYSMPPEVQERLATQLAADGYVDCTDSTAIDPTPTDTDCVPVEPDAALQPGVPAEVTQPIREDREDTVYCPPEPTPPYTPSPTLSVLPTSQFAGEYGHYYGVCRATPYADTSPQDPQVAGFTNSWYGGEPFGLWAGLDPEMEGIWTTSSTVLWATHDGPFAEEQDPLAITIEGRRMDGAAPSLETAVLPVPESPLDDDVPASERDAQALIEMRFPEPGCWQVVGWASGDQLLSFVVEVVPEGESAQALRVRQHKEAIAAERDAAIPYPVPNTCAVDPWIGPEDRLLGRYPAEMVAGDDWTYSYFLDGGLMSLNTRLGLLYQGTNTVFWASVLGRLPGDDIYTAELLDGEPAGQAFTIERTHSAYDVELPSGVKIGVERAEITFPSSGCWELRVESDAVDFSQTIYVYPRPEDRAEAARDHERLYTVDLDGHLRGIDLETDLRFLSIWVGAYADVALSPDGLTLYAVSDAESDRLIAFDAITGDEKWRADVDYWKVGYLGSGGPPTIAASADGDTLAVYGQDSEAGPHDAGFRILSLHDAETGEPVTTAPFPFRMSEGNVVLYSCAASIWPSMSGNRVLAICKGGGSYNVLDMTTGELVESMAGVPVSGTAVEIAASTHGTLVYVVTNQGDVAVYDRESMEIVDSVELIADVQPAWSGAALSPDGTRLNVALSSTDTGAYFREVRVFDTATWEEVDRFELPFDGFGRSMAVDSAGNLYGIEWLSTTRTQVWKRDATTGEVTVMVVADAEVHQLLVAGGE